MALKEFLVTNITQGRVEILAYRRVLEPGESMTVAEPIDEEVAWKVGERLVSVHPKQDVPAKVQLSEQGEPSKKGGRRN